MKDTTKRVTLTQSEELKVGQRGQYQFQDSKLAAASASAGITAWIEKRKSDITADDRNLRQFVDISVGYKLVYGITFEGKDYDCGDMPRDLGRVIRGIRIAKGLVK